jgi:hypothetical protein
MDARLARAAILVAAFASLGASYRTANFVVNAPSQPIAEQIGKQAEAYRRDLAVLWLGSALPNWSQPCPITAQVAPNLGAGGATSFMFDAGEVFGWQMQIQGSLERILDSVLPHEITHTIFASHFRRPLPRWADEGACTTVEHTAERSKQQQMLISFLRTNRGIPFHSMFAMKEYPQDVLPLYAQGHSLATFLIQQGGRQKFLNFVAAGLQSDQWPAVTKQHYGYANLAELQNTWLDWVRKGSPAIQAPASASDTQLADASRTKRAVPNLIYRGQSNDPLARANTNGSQAPGAIASSPAANSIAADLVPVARPPQPNPPVPPRDIASAPPRVAPAAWHPAGVTAIPGPAYDRGEDQTGQRMVEPGGPSAGTSGDESIYESTVAEGPAGQFGRSASASSIYMTRNNEPLAAE